MPQGQARFCRSRTAIALLFGPSPRELVFNLFRAALMKQIVTAALLASLRLVSQAAEMPLKRVVLSNLGAGSIHARWRSGCRLCHRAAGAHRPGRRCFEESQDLRRGGLDRRGQPARKNASRRTLSRSSFRPGGPRKLAKEQRAELIAHGQCPDALVAHKNSSTTRFCSMFPGAGLTSLWTSTGGSELARD